MLFVHFEPCIAYLIPRTPVLCGRATIIFEGWTLHFLGQGDFCFRGPIKLESLEIQKKRERERKQRETMVKVKIFLLRLSH